MADSFGKKARQQKRAKKRQEKLERKQEKKNQKSQSPEDMIVYVDEFGNFTDVPPDQQKRQEIEIEDIQLGYKPEEGSQQTEFTGTVTLFFVEKAYGFIREDKTGESVFVHANNAEGELHEKDRVVFEKEKTPKGFAAIKVKKLK